MPPVTTTKTNTGRKKGMVICQKTRMVAGAVDARRFFQIVRHILQAGQEETAS